MRKDQFDKEVDILLKSEAQRIFDILWDMTSKKIAPNKPYIDLVYDLITDEYKCYYFEIMNKITKLIPMGWIINSEDGTVFITDEEWDYRYELNKRKKYEKYSKVNNELINNVVDSIIRDYESHKLDNKSLFHFFNLYYHNYEDLDFDYEYINSLLKCILEKLNKHYQILKISPLCLKKI